MEFKVRTDKKYEVIDLTPQVAEAVLAARVSERTGQPLKADAFRKQLSRARRFFAGLLIDEVAQGLQERTPERVEEELVDLGLMPFVRDFLPPDWRSRGTLADSE